MKEIKQMTTYNTVAENPCSTVVAEYVPDKQDSVHYQSEQELEHEFISQLQANGYEYVNITQNEDLLRNLRIQLCRLNEIDLSDSEWQQILHNYLANKNESISEKTAKIHEDYIFNLKRDDGMTKNFRLLDKDNIHNNSLQVINQYEADSSGSVRKNRYDVTVLVNGLPMVHLELKRRGVAIREAFNQIERYQRESFWAESGLFEYVQLFVISNGTHTKYYSNTTRDAHLKEQKGRKSRKKASSSFEFTCWWADVKNRRIPDLVDFSKTFFARHSLLPILIKYCVLTSDKLLLVMRPYQIAATERIINRIEIATNDKKSCGTTDAGGYIWHTTGSGKTLTSFKAAQLASRMSGIDKVLFVVDRKDLDYQTMKEYDRFEKGSANANTSTKILGKQLADPNVRIIITTIQKLSWFVSKNKKDSILTENIVLIFDECHRSQFGEMHKKITKAFKHYYIFGFTGTPIFSDSSSSGRNTTEQVFGKKLHAYTIVDAIYDKNVLPFRVDYINTVKMKEGIQDKKVYDIDSENAAKAPKRIQAVTNYILEHFEQKTKREDHYTFNKLTNISQIATDKKKDITKRVQEFRKNSRIKGFNSVFTVSSIDLAKKYYNEFQKHDSGLKVATIFSSVANENNENQDHAPSDEDLDTTGLDPSSRDFLDMAIKDYNRLFETNYDTSAEKFENYYRDLSLRMKNGEIDLLIVVNMFLTGFDAPTLNTLWVDKNLREHGLLQAFSRTNRILNSVKTFGNIICFRNLEQATNDALAIFGNNEAGGIVLLKSFDEYYNGWDSTAEAVPNQDSVKHKGYKDLIAELQERFPLSSPIESDQNEKDFINLWGSILRLRNILTSFDEFADKEILSERNLQDYQSKYLDLYDTFRKQSNANKENINDDIEFEIEFITQITVTIDYILQLVGQYHQSKDKEIRIKINSAVDSSIELRSKKELIEEFINSLNMDSDIDRDWPGFVEKRKADELEKIIAAENLKPEQTKKFIANAFRDGELKSTGTEFASILPPISMFDKGNKRARKKLTVLSRLKQFFEKYSGI